MLRDEGLCECGALATQVDHVIPLELGARLPGHRQLSREYIDSVENRRAICDDCHRKKTAAEAARARGAA
jgi:5-methylcytosine-specific restriction endonuclease McrA